DQDDVVLHLEAVHLDEQLVQRLLALVVAAAETSAAVTADRVDLVHEDDARRRLLGLLEQVAHARRADADEHLDEVGARDREERHAGPTGGRAPERRLAGAGGAVGQHSLRDARAERLELLRVLEELLDLLELLDRLVDAGDVLEADLRRVRRHALRTRLAEAHHLRATALDLVHQEDPEADQEQERQERPDQRRPREAALTLRVVLDVVAVEQVLELHLALVARVVDRDLRLRRVALGRGDRELRGVEDDLLEVRRILADHRLQLRVGRSLGVAVLRDQGLAGQPDEQHDDDEGEESAAEEAVHRASRVPEGLSGRPGFSFAQGIGLYALRHEVLVPRRRSG